MLPRTAEQVLWRPEQWPLLPEQQSVLRQYLLPREFLLRCPRHQPVLSGKLERLRVAMLPA